MTIMKKLTKEIIAKLAKEIAEWADFYGKNYTLFYNNKSTGYVLVKQTTETGIPLYEYEWRETDNINPQDYFNAPDNHILSMTFDGGVFEEINYYGGDGLRKILKKYGLYYEQYNAWDLSVFPIDDAMEIEYTIYKREPDPIRFNGITYENVPYELVCLAKAWQFLSSQKDRGGSCVIGEGFIFTYKGIKYKMTNSSIHQGSLNWEHYVPFIKQELEELGAEEIYYDYGRMD